MRRLTGAERFALRGAAVITAGTVTAAAAGYGLLAAFCWLVRDELAQPPVDGYGAADRYVTS